MDALDQAELARQLSAASYRGGLVLVVPRQTGDTATRLVEHPAGMAEWCEVVGLIYRRGYRLRPAPLPEERPALRLATNERPDHDFPDDPA